jgi:hypothetical protein
MMNFEEFRSIGQIAEQENNEVEQTSRYTLLKRREYYGDISQEELGELLGLDFQEQLESNPPIEGIFSPEEELSKISKLPKVERKDALDTFKERLVSQREALASCRIFIERCIAVNNDVPKEYLMNWVEKFGSKYGFSDTQRKIAEGIIDKYYTYRKRAQEISKSFPDDKSLVQELTHIPLDNSSDFNVSVGPMTVDIRADSETVQQIYRKRVPLTTFRAGGFATTSDHPDPVLFSVIDKDDPVSRIAIHEHEHQKNRVLREVLDTFEATKSPASEQDGSEEVLILSRYGSENEAPDIKEELLETYFLLKRQRALERAKDEILAMKKSGDTYFEDFFKPNSPYNYLEEIINREVRKNDPIWQKVARKVLIDEYRTIIDEALFAFNILQKDGKYTIEEVIAMFADKPLIEWSKTAKRLLEQLVIEPDEKETSASEDHYYRIRESLEYVRPDSKMNIFNIEKQRIEIRKLRERYNKLFNYSSQSDSLSDASQMDGQEYNDEDVLFKKENSVYKLISEFIFQGTHRKTLSYGLYQQAYALDEAVKYSQIHKTYLLLMQMERIRRNSKTSTPDRKLGKEIAMDFFGSRLEHYKKTFSNRLELWMRERYSGELTRLEAIPNSKMRNLVYVDSSLDERAKTTKDYYLEVGRKLFEKAEEVLRGSNLPTVEMVKKLNEIFSAESFITDNEELFTSKSMVPSYLTNFFEFDTFIETPNNQKK